MEPSQYASIVSFTLVTRLQWCTEGVRQVINPSAPRNAGSSTLHRSLVCVHVIQAVLTRASACRGNAGHQVGALQIAQNSTDECEVCVSRASPKGYFINQCWPFTKWPHRAVLPPHCHLLALLLSSRPACLVH
jgi:hypothetical protein